MKMIIRNCPAIYGIDDGFLCSYREDEEDEKYCLDCTNCILKQIYKLCKDDYTQFGDKELRYDTLEEIIKLLDIEEAE